MPRGRLIGLTMLGAAIGPLTFVAQPEAQDPNAGGVESRAALDERRWGRDGPEALQARFERLEQALAELGGHRWAGTYFAGDGLGANVALMLAPEAGFVATWHGCMGLYDHNHGRVLDVGGGRLLLEFERPLDEGILRHEVSREMLVVEWGERRVLLREEDLEKYLDDVASGAEPARFHEGMYLTSRDRRTMRELEIASAPPVFPAGLVERTLPALGGRAVGVHSLELEVDEQWGVLSGLIDVEMSAPPPYEPMQLVWIRRADDPNKWVWASVWRTDGRVVTARVQQQWPKDAPAPVIKVGCEATTGARLER